MSKKKGLKVRDVAKDHFSSGVNINDPKFSRLIIRIIEGSRLLASDVETGKSDPVCFLWVGPISENPKVPYSSSAEAADVSNEFSYQTTAVCPTTIDPIWNEDIVFELDMSDVNQAINQKCVIYVRDEDKLPDDEGTTYDELGMLEFTLKEIISRGKAQRSSIVRSAQWYDLKKSPGMRKVEGRLKLTITMIFSPEDTDLISQQLPPPSPGAVSGVVPSHQGVGYLLQSTFKDPSLANDNGDVRMSINSLRGSRSDLPRRSMSTSPGRPGMSSSDSVASMVSYTRPKSAKIVRKSDSGSRALRPASAPNHRYGIDPVEEEEDAIAEERGNEDAEAANSAEADDEEESELIILPKKAKLPPIQKQHKASSDDLLASAAPPQGDESFLGGLINDIGGDIIQDLGATAIEKTFDVLGRTAQKLEQELSHGAHTAITGALAKVGEAAGRVSQNAAKTLASVSKDALANLNDGVVLSKQISKGAGTLLANGRDSPFTPVDAAESGISAGIGLLASKLAKSTTASANASPRSILGKDIPNANSAASPPTASRPAGGLLEENKLVISRPAQKDAAAAKSVAPNPEALEKKGLADKEGLSAKQHDDLLRMGAPPKGDCLTPEEEEEAAAAAKKGAAKAASAVGDALADDDSVRSKNKVQGVDGEKLSRGPSQQSLVASPSSVALVKHKASPTEQEEQEAAEPDMHNQDDGDLLAASQGNSTTSVVRILKELRQQKQDLQHSLLAIAQATEKGLQRLSERLNRLEDDSAKPQKKSQQQLMLENGPSGAGDEDLPEEEEEAVGALRKKKGISSKKSSTSATEETTSSNKSKGATSKDNSSSKFRDYRRQKIREQYAYTAVGGGAEVSLRQPRSNHQQLNATSPARFSSGGMPAVQMVYRDETGGIAATPVVPPSSSSSNSNNNSHDSAAYPSLQLARSPSRPTSSYGSSNNNPASSGYSNSSVNGGAFNMNSTTNLGPTLSSSSNANAHGSGSGTVLNRDFCAVLDGGGLEDVARLLESCPAKPEQLSISTRNRVYDTIATLLLQKKHVERSLIWITALLRGPNSDCFSDLTAHTQRDLLQAVHVSAQEASKRGVLASLLHSQLDRAMTQQAVRASSTYSRS